MSFLLTEIAKPLIHRAGTAISAALIGYSLATPEAADVVSQAFVIVSGLLLDLVSRKVV